VGAKAMEGWELSLIIPIPEVSRPLLLFFIALLVVPVIIYWSRRSGMHKVYK